MVSQLSLASSPCLTMKTELLLSREKGDASKTQDFLLSNKQYLVTHGVPCLCHTMSLAYTYADDEAERLLSFTNSSAPSTEGDRWVKMYTSCQACRANTATNVSEMADIRDLDGNGQHNNEESIAKGLGVCR